MIVKRIRKHQREARGSTSQLATRVLSLSNYIVDADTEQLRQAARVVALSGYVLDRDNDAESVLAGEKVEAFGSLNLTGPALPEWQMEMLAVAARAPRSRSPIEHYVLSWQQKEHPDPDQAREAAETFLEVLGLERCQAIWALHANTDNDHVHIMVNRIDPATGKAVQAGEGWDIDAAHKAIALIEDRQGWAQEPGALYFARQGALFDARTGRPVALKGKSKRKPSTDEKKIALPAAAGRGAVLQALQEATSWQDLHHRLATLKAAYERKGSGAIIRLDQAAGKASAWGRHCTLKAMELRLGPYVADQRPPNLGYAAYRQACRDELARIRQARAVQLERLEAHREATLAALAGSLPPDTLQVLTAALNAEFAAARRAVSAAFATAIDSFARARLDQGQWLAAGHTSAAPQMQLPAVLVPASIQRPEQRTSVQLEGKPVTARRRGWATQYVSNDRRVLVTDHRVVIIVHSPDAVSVSLAVTLAARRWQVVRAEGSPEFLARCAQVASRLEIRLVDRNNKPLLSPAQSRHEVLKPRPHAAPPSMPARVPLAKQPAEPPKRDQSPGREIPSVEEDTSLEQLLWWQQRNGRGR